jgi:microcystin-dependent protein
MSSPFLGQIIQGGWNFAPRGFALCNGQQLSIAQNTALFALLGTNFGGNGQTTFGLPNLQSRTMMHWGQGSGLSNVVLGEQGGTESVTLTAAQMPSHTHTATLTASTTTAEAQGPGPNGTNRVLGRALDSSGSVVPLVYAPAGSPLNSALGAGSVVNAATGGSQPHSIRNPYLGITHVIALQGIFPSRS